MPVVTEPPEDWLPPFPRGRLSNDGPRAKLLSLREPSSETLNNSGRRGSAAAKVKILAGEAAPAVGRITVAPFFGIARELYQLQRSSTRDQSPIAR